MQTEEILFVVTMHRWGDVENHSYVIGAYSSLDLAKQEAQKERDYRGGKYEYRITKHTKDFVLTEDKDGFWNKESEKQGMVAFEKDMNTYFPVKWFGLNIGKYFFQFEIKKLYKSRSQK